MQPFLSVSGFFNHWLFVILLSGQGRQKQAAQEDPECRLHWGWWIWKLRQVLGIKRRFKQGKISGVEGQMSVTLSNPKFQSHKGFQPERQGDVSFSNTHPLELNDQVNWSLSESEPNLYELKSIYTMEWLCKLDMTFSYVM